METKIDRLVNMLVTQGFMAARQVMGLVPPEVSSLESHLPYPLPTTYKEFLLTLGHSAGSFFRGTDFIGNSPARLLELQQEARELFSDCGLNLPEDAFVFSSHQGYIVHFFRLSGTTDDPPVFGYKEGDMDIKLCADHFSDFLFGCVNDFLGACRKMKEIHRGATRAV